MGVAGLCMAGGVTRVLGGADGTGAIGRAGGVDAAEAVGCVVVIGRAGDTGREDCCMGACRGNAGD